MSWRDVWEDDFSSTPTPFSRPSEDDPSLPSSRGSELVVAARKAEVVPDSPSVPPPVPPSDRDDREHFAMLLDALHREHEKQMNRLMIVFLVIVAIGLTYVDGVRRDIRRLVEPRLLE